MEYQKSSIGLTCGSTTNFLVCKIQHSPLRLWFNRWRRTYPFRSKLRNMYWTMDRLCFLSGYPFHFAPLIQLTFKIPSSCNSLSQIILIFISFVLPPDEHYWAISAVSMLSISNIIGSSTSNPIDSITLFAYIMSYTQVTPDTVSYSVTDSAVVFCISILHTITAPSNFTLCPLTLLLVVGLSA